MFNNRIKYFWAFDELSVDEKRDFLDFKRLNFIIEENNLTKEQIEQSYIKAFLKEKDESDIHIELKYLLDEINVACNKILDFINFKFCSYKDAILWYSKKSWFLDYHLVEQILDSNESLFTLIIWKIWWDEEKIQMQFNKWREDEFLEFIMFLLNKYNEGYIINIKLDKVFY